MQLTTAQNKAIVTRFNKEFIEQGKLETFKELVADDVYNHNAPPGASTGPDGMLHFLQNVLQAGLSDIRVEIFEQIAENDLVTTRKRIYGTHKGTLLGIAPTGRQVSIDVIDIIRLKNGKYAEHWGASNFSDVLKQLSMPA